MANDMTQYKTVSDNDVQAYIARAHKMRSEAFGNFFSELFAAWRGGDHAGTNQSGAATA